MALGITHRVWSIGDLIEAELAAVPTKPTSTRAQRRCHRGRRRRFRERGFMSPMLFLDEIADRQSVDPVELRLALLKDTPRGQAVVRAVMEMSDYRRSRSGRSLGLAFADYSNTMLAGVAEVSVDRSSGAIRVHNVWVAIDPGIAVQPDNIVAQTESSIVYGLGLALTERITFKDGVVQQSNFYDYRVPRLRDVPEMHVKLMPTPNPPTVVGQMATPLVARPSPGRYRWPRAPSYATRRSPTTGCWPRCRPEVRADA